jgi:hypothetical protein
VSGLAPFGAEGLDWFAGMAPADAAELRAAAAGRAAHEAHFASAAFDPVTRSGGRPSARRQRSIGGPRGVLCGATMPPRRPGRPGQALMTAGSRLEHRPVVRRTTPSACPELKDTQRPLSAPNGGSARVLLELLADGLGLP